MNFFVATPEHGQLFHADQPAAAGATLRAVDLGDPFPARGLVASERVEGALASLIPGWPGRLWEVTGTPVEKLDEFGTHRFDELTVICERDRAEMYGPNGHVIVEFLHKLAVVKATDLNPTAATTEDEHFAAHPDSSGDDAPAFLAYGRAKQAADSAGRGLAFDKLTMSLSSKLADALASHLWFFELKRGRGENPYERAKFNYANALFHKLAELSAGDLISEADRELLAEDWRRLTR